MAEGGGMRQHYVNNLHKSINVTVRTKLDEDAVNTDRPQLTVTNIFTFRRLRSAQNICLKFCISSNSAARML
jgi:hypothetical protein